VHNTNLTPPVLSSFGVLFINDNPFQNFLSPPPAPTIFSKRLLKPLSPLAQFGEVFQRQTLFSPPFFPVFYGKITRDLGSPSFFSWRYKFPSSIFFGFSPLSPQSVIYAIKSAFYLSSFYQRYFFFPHPLLSHFDPGPLSFLFFFQVEF